MGGGGGSRNKRLENLQAQTLEDEIQRRKELEADLETRRRLRTFGGARQLRFFGPGRFRPGQQQGRTRSPVTPAAAPRAPAPGRSRSPNQDSGGRGGDAGQGSGGGGDAGSGGGGGGGAGTGGCFVGETLVATPYGQVPIATISVGQQVTAFNIIGDREPRHVLNVFEYHDRDTWRLEVESVGEILVTGEHPFKVPGGGDEYLTVDDMVVGDLLLTEEGETVEVVSKTPGPSRTVHNLNVEGLHTYMAGGLRVHNEK